MTTEIGSIDDLLTNQTIKPKEVHHDSEIEESTSEINEDIYSLNNDNDKEHHKEVEEQDHNNESQQDSDEYGNEKPQENEVIRDRLARQAESLKRQHQAEIDSLRQEFLASQNKGVQKGSKDFEYDEN